MNQQLTENHLRILPHPSLGGGDGRRPERSPSKFFDDALAEGEARREYLMVLRGVLLELVGNEECLETLLGWAGEELTLSSLGCLWDMDRRTVKKCIHEWLELLRQRSMERLAQVAAEAIETSIAITLDPMRLERVVASTDLYVVVHEAVLAKRPRVDEVLAYLDQARTLLFGPRSVLLALRRTPSHTRAAVLVQARRALAVEHLPATNSERCAA